MSIRAIGLFRIRIKIYLSLYEGVIEPPCSINHGFNYLNIDDVRGMMDVQYTVFTGYIYIVNEILH